MLAILGPWDVCGENLQASGGISSREMLCVLQVTDQDQRRGKQVILQTPDAGLLTERFASFPLGFWFSFGLVFPCYAPASAFLNGTVYSVPLYIVNTKDYDFVKWLRVKRLPSVS